MLQPAGMRHELRTQKGTSALRATALFFLLATASHAAGEGPSEQISFDRPEAWALKYFAAVSTFTPLQAPRERAPGAIELSLEGGWVPYLSESERRVGFNGTKVEDLNRTSVFGRPRILVGLPAGFAVEAGWVPPIEINGAKTNILNGAVEKTFFDDPRGSFGLRLYGQLGYSMGDYTCPADVVGYPPGSPQNPLGCSQPSTDTARLNDFGAALTGGVKLGGAALHFAGGGTYNDLQFQTGAYGAYTNGEPDNTLLTTHGWTGWIAGGGDFPIGAKFSISAEAFYSPLRVKRPPSTESQNDPLFNVRVLLRWALN